MLYHVPLGYPPIPRHLAGQKFLYPAARKEMALRLRLEPEGRGKKSCFADPNGWHVKKGDNDAYTPEV